MAEQKKPQDRKPSKQSQQRTEKQQQEMVAKFMAAGIDFEPHIVDAGDGVEWAFKPDPMPGETSAVANALRAMEEEVKKSAGGDGSEDDLDAAIERLVAAIRNVLEDPKQAKEFPKPNYGAKALMFFALKIATGKDGFPTEEA